MASLQLGLNEGQQILDRQFLHVLRVEPLKFRTVKDAIGAADARKIEFFEQLFRAQELLVAAGRPAKQREKVSERLREEAFGAIHVYVGGAVALGQARFVSAENQRQMRENRWLSFHGAIEQNLLRRVGKMIGPAN